MRNEKDIEIKAMKVKGNIHKNGKTRIIKGVIEKSIQEINNNDK
jgi:hypothetical protein